MCNLVRDKLLKELKWEELAVNNTINVVDLEDSYFLNNNMLLNKYFIFKDHSLDRFHMPEVEDEEYLNIAKTIKLADNNLNQETASKYSKEKVYAEIVRRDFKIPNNFKISFTGYCYSDDYYECYDYQDNVIWLEDKFRETEDDYPSIIRVSSIDTEIWDKLYKYCVKAIKNRLAMILEIPGIIHQLYDVLEYTEGFSINCTSEMSRSLYARYSNFVKLIHNKELVNWVKEGNNDYTLYGKSVECFTDYIESYHKMLYKLSNGNVEYYKDIIHNDIDLLENFIFEDELSDFEIRYIENCYKDDSEEESEENVDYIEM